MDAYFYISKIFTPLIVPSNFFIFILIISFYFGIYKKRIFFKKIFVTIFILFSIISTIPVGSSLIFFFLERDFIDAKVQKDLNYIFVPSGGHDRLIAAIRIKNEYNLDSVKIIYSTGKAFIEKDKATDVELLFVNNLILNSKIKKQDIIFLPEARNTLENFKRLNEYLILVNKKSSKILLITHGYHLKRSLMLASKYELQIYPFSSSLIHTKNEKSIINSYQAISFLHNLRLFDIFAKELISASITYFFII